MPVLTKRFIDGLTGDGRLRIIPDDELPGFALQVTASGAISYCIDYRVDGKRKRRVIGRHGPLTVEQARREAKIQLGQAASGRDPQSTHRVDTIAALFETWMIRHVNVHLRPNTIANYRVIFDKHCRPRFGAVAPHKLSYAAIADAKAAMKHTPIAANHMIRRMRSLLIWAEDNRLVTFKDGNPARGHRLRTTGRPHSLGCRDTHLHRGAATRGRGRGHPHLPAARTSARPALGRPRAINPEVLDQVRALLAAGSAKAAVCRVLGIRRSTLNDALKREAPRDECHTNFTQGRTVH